MADTPNHEDVLHLIGRVCGRNFHRMTENLNALGLYHRQPSVLNVLWEQEGMTHSELARKLHRSPSTITKTVQRMERAGFVERRDDPTDERISRVYLTDAGRDVRSAVEEIWHTYAAQAFGNFTEDERAQFHALLQRLYDNIAEEG